ncbi:uncharacterized protein LOC143197058 [Rhynchophorus ferrugineus]|uniref:uncharacterized protein LOC143197058 n=1 Tax=Rhynchophorus ferrugineus TaxID=354439 RepID=UPI003FCC67F0
MLNNEIIMNVVFILLGIIYLQLIRAERSKYVNFTGCSIKTSLQYECCASVHTNATIPNEYCFNANFLFRQLTINLNLKHNGEVLYSRKLDSNLAPICIPMTLLCFAINHIDIKDKRLCAKISMGPIVLLKFPCFTINNGRVGIIPNNYFK